jgi:hypothetical protein
MGKTNKKLPRTEFRCPRGRKKALSEGCRKKENVRCHSKAKGIPPDDWDDEKFDKSCFLPLKVALSLMASGVSVEDASRMVSVRFNIPYLQVLPRVATREKWLHDKHSKYYIGE